MNLLKVNICLSRQQRNESLELLKNCFIVDNSKLANTYQFTLQNFQKDLTKYLADPELQGKIEKKLNLKGNAKLMFTISQIPQNDNDQQYKLLKSALYEYLYKPEEGKNLLLEYQASRKKESNISFNQFLQNKLSKIQDLKDLEQRYPELYSSIKRQYPDVTVDSLHLLLKDKVVVADIYHQPQMIDNERQVLNDSFIDQQSLNFNTQTITGTEDYQPGIVESREELFNGGNFQGCTFRNIEFDCPLKNIVMRDCVFNKVAFSDNTLQDTDLRGVKLHDIVFSNNSKISNIKLDVANSDLAQALGIISLDNSNIPEEQKRRNDIIRENFGKQFKEGELLVAVNKKDGKVNSGQTRYINAGEGRYRQVLQNLIQNSKQKLESQEEGFLDLIIDRNYLAIPGYEYAKSLASSYINKFRKPPEIKELEANLCNNLEKIKQKYGSQDKDYRYIEDNFKEETSLYKLAQREYEQAINIINRVEIENPILDPTYSRGRFNENDYKLRIRVTRGDLEDFIKHGKDQNCADFIRKKYEHIVQGAQSEGIPVVVVPDATRQDLNKLDFSNRDMSGVILARCNLESCNFNNTNLEGACLEEAKVNNTSFKQAKLTDTNMIKISGDGANFERAVGARTRFMGAELGTTHYDNPANFTAAKLYALDAYKSDLQECNLKDSEMEFADFSRANMSYVDARYTKMQESNFKEAVMNSINSHEADFTNSCLKEAEALRGNFAKAKFDSVNAEEMNAMFANFERASMENIKAKAANFVKANMEKVSAQRADLQDSLMDFVKAKEADFTKANMEKVKAIRADFEKSLLNDVNAKEADLAGASLNNATACNINIKGANLDYVDARGADLTGAEHDVATGLYETDLRGTKCDPELKENAERNVAFFKLFGDSKYPRCYEVDENGVNQRYNCQKLGAQILAAASAGGAIGGAAIATGGFATAMAGITLGGASAGLAWRLSGDLLNKFGPDDRSVGYINSGFGDYLANIGAIAKSAGIGAMEGSLGGIETAITLCQMGLSDAKLAQSIRKLQNIELPTNKEEMLKTLKVLSETAKNTYNSNIITSSAKGSVKIGAQNLYESAKDLYNYKADKDGNTIEGKTPEEIYIASSKKYEELKERYLPTWKKFMQGLTSAGGTMAVGGGIAATVGVLMPPLAPITVPIIAIGTAVATPVAGYFGYKYGFDGLKERAVNLKNNIVSKTTNLFSKKNKSQEISKNATIANVTTAFNKNSATTRNSSEISHLPATNLSKHDKSTRVSADQVQGIVDKNINGKMIEKARNAVIPPSDSSNLQLKAPASKKGKGKDDTKSLP